MTHYVELQVLTHFSLLRGASSPEELFAAAALLGYLETMSPASPMPLPMPPCAMSPTPSC